MPKKRGVGLVIVTKLPDIGLCALLRERGAYNFEDMKKESWQGACQVTCHGGLNPGEEKLDGLGREVSEEFGIELAHVIRGDLDGLVRVGGIENEEKEMTTYGYYLADPSIIAKCRLHSSGGRIVPVTPDMKLNVLSKPAHREAGVDSRSYIALHQDEVDAVAKALEVFASK